ncbi:MAG TPA: glycoside hydrolase family 5 protein [Phycisphaerae bacterium]
MNKIFILLAAVLGSASVASAAAPPMKMLKIDGTKIVDSDGQPVRLRGVNCASMEWTSNGEGHILKTVQVAIDDWKCNCLRLPLTQDRWFGKANEQNGDAKPYRDLVEQVVKLCESKGCYVILDLHWNDLNEWGKWIGQHSMPDDNSVAFWKDFAKLYANRPAVIFDLYNEPHDVSWDVWLNGGQITDRPNTAQGGQGGEPHMYKAVGMQQMLDTVRETGAMNLIVAGGLDWSYDMSGFLNGHTLKDPKGNGVIYANHAYTNKNESAWAWIEKMEKATAVVPVIVSEFGDNNNAGRGGGRRGARGAVAPGAVPGRGAGAGLPVNSDGLFPVAAGPAAGAPGLPAAGAAPGAARRGRGEGTSPNGDNWLLHVMQGIEDHKWSYTAWDLHTSAGPTLISDWNYTPTPGFGAYVKQMLDDKYPKYVAPPRMATIPTAPPSVNIPVPSGQSEPRP